MVKSYLGRLYIITRGYSQTRANRHKGDEDKVTRNGPQVVDLTLDRSDEEVEEDEFQPHHLSDEEEAEEEEIFHADDERQDDLTNEDQLPGQASSPPRPPHSPISPVPSPIPQVTQLSRLAVRPTHSTVHIPPITPSTKPAPMELLDLAVCNQQQGNFPAYGDGTLCCSRYGGFIGRWSVGVSGHLTHSDTEPEKEKAMQIGEPRCTRR